MKPRDSGSPASMSTAPRSAAGPGRGRGRGWRGPDQARRARSEEAGRRVQVAGGGDRHPQRVRRPALGRSPGRHPRGSLTSSRGLSARIVPAPTRIASEADRSSSTSSRSCGPDRMSAPARRRPGSRRGRRRSSPDRMGRAGTFSRVQRPRADGLLDDMAARAVSPTVPAWGTVRETILESLNPATGEVLATYGYRRPARGQPPVDRARDAAAWWGGLSHWAERKLRLLAWKSHLTRYMGRLAQLVHDETGKPLDDATAGDRQHRSCTWTGRRSTPRRCCGRGGCRRASRCSTRRHPSSTSRSA